ncbi:MAG: GNVR domain-containing protein [Terriglobales bacterium]
MDRVNSEVLAPPVERSQDSEQGVGYEYLDSQPTSTTTEGPTLRLIEVAWLLWSKRRFLVRLTACGLVLFTIIAFLLPKHYTAVVHLMPPDYSASSQLAMSMPSLSGGGDEEGSGGGGGVGGGGGSVGVGSVMGFASKLLGLSTSGSLIAGVAQSRTVEDNIIAQFGLMNLYRTKYPEDARKILESTTEIKEDTKTGIISLSFEDKDPRRAAAIAQAYVENLNHVLAGVNASSAHRERLFIDQRLLEVKKDLDASAKEFAEFASANSAINIPEQAKAMVGAAADLEAKLIAAQSMLGGLRQIYTDSNVNVRQMEASVAELQKQINQFGGRDVIPAGGTSLPKSELYPSVRQLPLLGVKYLDLYRRNKINEAVFEFLTKQGEIARVEEARDVPSVQVLDPAAVPQKKTSPRRLLIMIIGMSFTFFAGASWLIGGAYWDRIDPQEPWKVFAREVFLRAKSRTWDSRLAVAIRGVARTVVSKVSSSRGAGTREDDSFPGSSA